MSEVIKNKVKRTFEDSYQSSSKKTRRMAFEQAAKLLEEKQWQPTSLLFSYFS